jgi:DNA repair protein RadC
MPSPLPPTLTQDLPRERLWSLGAAALTTVELIAILLGTGRAGHDVRRTAEDVLAQGDGSLRQLAGRPPAELLQTAGIGRTKAGRLIAALELGARLGREARPVPARIRTPADVARVASRIADLKVEEFHLLALSVQHEVLRDILITRGLLNSSLVHPREVFRAAIAEAAAGIVLVHNHPSGDPTPSAEDREVTRQLVAAGALLGIPVLDHVIVAGDQFVSLSSLGLV